MSRTEEAVTQLACTSEDSHHRRQRDAGIFYMENRFDAIFLSKYSR